MICFFRKLTYVEPQRIGGKVVVKPPKEAMDVGISKWEASLVGQFLDKAPPFMVVKQFHGSKEQVLI